MFPGLREGKHAPAASDASHLGNVPVDEGGGAPVEGVQVGALEEFRGEFPGVEGDAFHPPSMGAAWFRGEGSCHAGVVCVM